MHFDNCYISAWKAYRNGDAVWMDCRQSKFARLQGKMPWLARALGSALMWTATGFWLIGHMLIFGTWPHWIFCDRLEGDCMEAVPDEGEKSDHLFPPLLFKTRTQRPRDVE